MSLNRRNMIRRTATAVSAIGVSSAAADDGSADLAADPAANSSPTIIVNKPPVTLRVLGTHVTLQRQIKQRAERDLNIKLQFSPGGSAAVLHQAATRADSFDLYEQWSNSIRVLWQARSIVPIDTTRIRYWDEINPLSKTGRLTPSATLGDGDAPYRLLHVQPDGSLGETPTGKVSFLPYVHNVDSFGYHAGVVPRGEPYQTESWAWLLDEQWSGRVAVVNAPTIGLFDLALAIQAKGLMSFANIGDITRQELDRMFSILIDYRRRGHFRGVWSSVPESVELMQRGETVVQSMFSPGVYELQADDIPCVYASPKEGYRGWHGVMCLSSTTARSPAMKRVADAAYEYMNWWLSGWPGAFIARQGYYISNPARSRTLLSRAEWDYWYGGKPAANDLMGTNATVAVKKGSIRDGGSYQNRFNHIAVWNTVMNSYEYSLRRWNEFLSASSTP